MAENQAARPPIQAISRAGGKLKQNRIFRDIVAKHAPR